MQTLTRDGKPSDLAYVTDVWCLLASRYLRSSVRDAKHAAQATLKRSRLVIACLPDDTDAIVGFAVLEGDRCHMVYVRSYARRMGICRRLFG